MTHAITTEILTPDYVNGGFRRLDKNELQPGQVLIKTGPGCCQTTAWLERIDKTGTNWKYYYIACKYHDDGKRSYYRSCTNEIRPYSKVFGIGTYYNDLGKPEIISRKELAAIVQKCDREEARQRAALAAEQAETQAAAERGRALWTQAEKQLGFKPAAVIIAELRQDESDSMTDYFGSRPLRRVVLAFSKHDRRIFSEMRKAAAKSTVTEIQELATAPAEFEHRENYSMGHGIYLGTYFDHNGWKVYKTSFHDNLYADAGRPGGFEVLN